MKKKKMCYMKSEINLHLDMMDIFEYFLNRKSPKTTIERMETKQTKQE